MRKPFARWILILSLFVAPLSVYGRQAPTPAPQFGQELATAEQLAELKVQAYQAFKGGQFDRTSELLSRAASLSSDPSLVQMSQWIAQFQMQRQGFVEERRKQFDKAVAETHKLIDAHKLGFAIDRAKDAYLLADDKEAFRKEPWVDSLVKTTIELAGNYEKEQQWLKALRLYSDLGSIEPGNPEWKDKLKLATRRIRLLLVYTPEDFKSVQEAEIKEREEIDALLNPTTQPTTKPAFEENDSFKSDWHESIAGIRIEMLMDALEETRNNYYRDIGFQKLTLGGLRGLHTLATTPGLERAFPNLADQHRRQTFLNAVNLSIQEVERANPSNEHIMLRATLMNLQVINRDTLQLPEEVLVSEFADGAFGDLDQFTGMIWPSSLDEFQRTTQGEFSGVGIQIQTDDEGNLKVISPLEDTPAYKLGIEAGDIIARINGKNARNISIDQAVKHITGPQGTTVTLTIRKTDGSMKDYTIRREQIKVASVKGWQHLPGGGWDFFVDSDQRIAYVRLTNFTRTSDEELRKVLAESRKQGARGMILDLRDNPGGLLTSATDVADRFLEDGTIVSTRGERGNVPEQPAIDARPSYDDATIPLVVLVNQFSASASEIVSGALQDHKRALVVGERTFGKGSVQMLFPLAKRTAALKLTTSHYYLPSGRCIHREENASTWGVDPDLLVEMTPKQKKEAIEARQELDVLRDKARQGSEPVKPTKDLLACDPQLSAALLLLRLQLAGGVAM